MPKIARRKKFKRKTVEQPISWLPIDSRFLPDIISFGHVKGIARVFLIIEMILAVVVVIATFSLVFLKAAGVIA